MSIAVIYSAMQLVRLTHHSLVPRSFFRSISGAGHGAAERVRSFELPVRYDPKPTGANRRHFLLQAETGAGILTVGLVLGATASKGAAASLDSAFANRPFVMADGSANFSFKIKSTNF
jgi:hypothetical protein